MNIYNLVEEIEYGNSHYVGEPFDNFMFKEVRPYVHGKGMIKRGLYRYKLRTKNIKLKFYNIN